MTAPTSLAKPDRMDEAQIAQDFSAVLSQVASEGRPVIVRRNGEDLAAVIPLEHLELLRDALAREEVEQQASRINWGELQDAHRPPQEWYDDTDNPFEPAAEPGP